MRTFYCFWAVQIVLGDQIGLQRMKDRSGTRGFVFVTSQLDASVLIPVRDYERNT